MSDLDDLKAAQFMLGPMYTDWIWQERVKAAPPVPQSKMRVAFKWQPSAKVINIASRKKKK